ncbi:MAG: two-component sensor histidine kinase [Clostridiales bacterium]|nr:two-component sensor histidine kinase [Clostridiales bacterium]
MFKSVRSKIILGIVLVSLMVHVITNAIMWAVFRENLKRYISNDMDKIKSITYKEVEQQYIYDSLEEGNTIKDKLLPMLNTVNKRYGCYISIDEDENNNIAFTGRVLNEIHKRDILIESKQKASILYMSLVEKGFYATYTYPMFIKDDYKGTLVLQKNYGDEYLNYKKIMTQIIIVETILYIIMLVILFLWLAKITSSLKELSGGMKLIGEGDYTRELPVRGNDEIANLTEHFNRMQGRITKQMEQLYIEKKRIEELERETKDFFNYATHEMKTPITAIKGYGELLDQGGIEEDKQRKIYSRIILEANRIYTLIGNMLIVARGMGKIEQVCESFNIKALLIEMTKELELTLEKEQVQIEVGIVDKQIYGVKEEIRVVFKNLIENGIKYSRDKKVYIENINNNPYIIRIRNSTLPIPDKIREHLLEPFVKYNYGDIEMVSSGLGLFICSELLTRNNGKITYEINEDEIFFIVEFLD